MKKLILIISIILIIAGHIFADEYLGYLKTTDYLQFPVHPALDTLGREVYACDSIHILVKYQSDTTQVAGVSYTTRSTTILGASFIDTSLLYGDTTIYFWDKVADIDADKGVGKYSIIAKTYYQGYPFATVVTFDLVDYNLRDLYLMADTTRDTVIAYLTVTPADSGVVERLIDSILDARGYSTFNYSSNQVTVATNNDKTGYVLAAQGLDSDTSFTQLQNLVSTYLDEAVSAGLDSAQLERLIDSIIDAKFMDSTNAMAGVLNEVNNRSAIGDTNDLLPKSYFWIGIDTSGTLDTSDIGDWIVNNTGGVAADTTNIKTMFENNPETFVVVAADTSVSGGNIGSVGADTTAIKTMFINNPATFNTVPTDTNESGEYVLVTDSTVNGQNIIDSINAVLDSLQNLDNWAAQQATLDSIEDSLQAWDDNIAYLDQAISNTADSGVVERLIDSILDDRGYSTLTLAEDSAVIERLIDSILDARGYATATALADVQTEVDAVDGWNPSTAFPSNFADLIITDSGTIYHVDILSEEIEGSDTVAILAMLQNHDFLQLLDSPNVARWIWDNDLIAQASRTINGSGITASIPDSLFDTLTSIHGDLYAGTGAYACSLYVFNESDSSAVQGVRVRIMNDAENATEAKGITNSNGLIYPVPGLDAAQYKIWLYKAGITASNPDSVTVTASGVTDTTYVEVFSPTTPASADLCNVYGTYTDGAGTAIEGAIVTCKLSKTNLVYYDSSYLLSPITLSDTTDSDGNFEIALIPNELILELKRSGSDYEYEAGTTLWRIEIQHPTNRSATVSRSVTVPNQTNWRLVW